MPQPLPPKEQALFKSIVKHYETKQYKKGLKASDQVLKKAPDHGETLAMRGLILSCLDRKVEAHEFVKKGLSKDIRSHVCWHVFGLVHRAERDYKEAVKAYRNALRIDPNNLQILRDQSLLQVQLRDRPGFLETRHALLKLKPGQRPNWVGLAIAYHLLGRHRKAEEVISAYERTLEGSEIESKYEHSEMLLYRAEVLRDGGFLKDAEAQLARAEAQIVDRTSWLEDFAQLAALQGHHEEARERYLGLLARNPEDYGLHAGVQDAVLKRVPAASDSASPGGASPYGAPRGRRPDMDSLSAEERATLLDLYGKLQTDFPRAQAPLRIPLDLIDVGAGAAAQEAFDRAFARYAKPLIRKGVPSLFSAIKSLYAGGTGGEPELGEGSPKAQRVGAVLDRWIASVRSTGKFGDEAEAEAEAEAPCVLMWLLFLKAQHLDRLGHHGAALAEVDLAIAHTPTLLELYVFKARVYKHAGNPAEAARWVEHARTLDLADRYLNTKATRYLLRAGRAAEAGDVIGLFTKDGPDRESNLYDMQCMWYELESGACHARAGHLGPALKKFAAVEQHFTDMVEDQFDFHNYCLRKMTLRAYVRILRMEESIWSHRFAHTAACEAIRIYLQIHDSRSRGASPGADGSAGAGAESGGALDEAERKKLASKAKKAAAREAAKRSGEKAANDAAVAKEASGKGGKGDGDKRPADEDPDGAKLAATETPLADACRRLATLHAHSAGHLETHLLACAVHTRRGTLLLALRAAKRAAKIAPADPGVHLAIIRLFLKADEFAALGPGAEASSGAAAAGGAKDAPALEGGTRPLAPAVRAVLDAQRVLLVTADGKPASLAECNVAFSRQHAGVSAAAACAAAELAVALDPSKAAEAAQELASKCPLQVGACDLASAIAVHALLAAAPMATAAPGAAAAFAERGAKRFPLAAHFGAPAPAGDATTPPAGASH